MKLDIDAFLASLRNGFGFTKTCDLLGLSPKEVTIYLTEHKVLLEECKNSVALAFKALLAASNTHIQKRQFDKWKNNNEYVRNYITSINLWECFCKKDEITPKKVCEAIFVYKDIEEAATAIGLTRVEINTYIMSNAHIGKYLRENLFLSR